jgi:hypothetical protein
MAARFRKACVIEVTRSARAKRDVLLEPIAAGLDDARPATNRVGANPPRIPKPRRAFSFGGFGARRFPLASGRCAAGRRARADCAFPIVVRSPAAYLTSQRFPWLFSIMLLTKKDTPRLQVSSVLPRRSTDLFNSTSPVAVSSIRILILRIRLLTF